VEYFAEHPIVNLKNIQNICSSAPDVGSCFFAFFNLFGSIVLLPIYLADTHGLYATLAGMVLGPGGVGNTDSHACSRQACDKVNPKGLLAFGIIGPRIRHINVPIQSAR